MNREGSENILFSRRQQTYPNGDERERVARARQAAEALFTPKQPTEPEPASATPTADEQLARKPRIFAIAPPAPAQPVPSAVEPARRPPRRSRGIPEAQHARIRTWVEYGMTAAEVAEVYGAAIGEIERILRKA
jgi:hypothetical protein